MKAAVRTESLVGELDAVLEARLVHCRYQPVVDLESGEVVAFEALARGPQGSPLESPANLFEAARRAGRLPELDWLCRTAAAEGALEAGLRAPASLLVNVEPQVLHKPEPSSLKQSWRRAGERFRIVLEVKELALTDDPAQLLWSIGWARETGLEIAVDAVGTDPRSLSLLELLRPEVVKIDLRLVRARPLHDQVAAAHAVAAHAERTGAAVIAQCIETDADLDLALAVGASRGQGWCFGRPRPLPEDLPRRGPVLHEARHPRGIPAGFTPFDLLRDRAPVKRASEAVLGSISGHLVHGALLSPEPPVVIAAVEGERLLAWATRDLLRELGRRGALVAALGRGIPPVPAAGVRGVSLGPRDPLGAQWVVVVLAPHFGAALAADLRAGPGDPSPRSDYVVTYDRDLVAEVARSLLPRILTA